MSGPRVLVIGQGSIGRRHATNLRGLGADVSTVDLEFDTDHGGRVPAGFDGVVVASPTVRHAAHALAALDTGAAVLVEKPLAWTAAEAAEVASRGGARVMVGYNLRYHAPLRRVAEMLADGVAGEPCSYRLWFGSWLPDWRPEVDYRESYSARADLGGGVLADAIHEVDLAMWFTRSVLDVAGAFVGRVGPLEIDVEDTVRALLVTAEGIPVTVDLDYLSRRYRRGVEIVGDEATISYDWATNDLRVDRDGGSSVASFDVPVAASYEAEAAAFLALITHGTLPEVTSIDGAESVRLAEAIRQAGSVREASR